MVLKSPSEQDNLLWVSIGLEPHVLRHYLQFPDPNAVLRAVLTEYCPQIPDEEQQTPPLGRVPPLAAEAPWEEIRQILLSSQSSIEGYHSIRRAAEAAYKHFGAVWLNPKGDPIGTEIRRKLRALLVDTLPANHSNKRVPWQRFQDYASRCESLISNGEPSASGAIK